MKDKILKLRSEGKTYNQIIKELGCSKALVSYYCGKGQKEKTYSRQKKRRQDNAICQRVEKFRVRRAVRSKSDDFQKRNENRKRIQTFTWRDVIEKFGWETTCYLTGKKINLKEIGTYQFDHIVPSSKGGSNELDNLGILCKEANIAKSGFLLEDFVALCRQIVAHADKKNESS